MRLWSEGIAPAGVAPSAIISTDVNGPARILRPVNQFAVLDDMGHDRDATLSQSSPTLRT